MPPRLLRRVASAAPHLLKVSINQNTPQKPVFPGRFLPPALHLDEAGHPAQEQKRERVQRPALFFFSRMSDPLTHV